MSAMPTSFEVRRNAYAVCAIMLTALLIRWRASLGEFWLDEIWSWFMVQVNVQSWSDVILTLKHDNNHFLNSWIIYGLGPERDWTTYRLPAVLFGTATVALAGWWGRRQGTSAGWFALVLTAGSYVLIHYSSEARGYAPLMFFSLLGFVAMERALATGRMKWDAVWNLAAIFGVLSHPTFVTLFVSVALWSMISVATKSASKGQAVVRFIRWHLLPVLFSGWVYRVNLSQLAIGGGLEQSPWVVIREALSLTMGGPFDGAGSIAAASAVAASFAGCLSWLIASGRKLTAFVFFMIIVAAPAALVVFAGRSDLYVRYFLISILFLLLLFSLALGRLYQSSGVRRGFAVAITAVMFIGNAVHVARLCDAGRGNYLAALEMIQQQTQDDRVVIASDNDFRHRLMITFYQNYLKSPQPIFLSDGRSPNGSPEWLLLHHFEIDWQAEQVISPIEGTRYDLMKAFPYAGLSGWSLGVYRRAEDETVPKK
ncbi:MAG: glycosyltransferase family 39 protein [Planctomycetaceae bacterium]